MKHVPPCLDRAGALLMSGDKFFSVDSARATARSTLLADDVLARIDSRWLIVSRRLVFQNLKSAPLAG